MSRALRPQRYTTSISEHLASNDFTSTLHGKKLLEKVIRDQSQLNTEGHILFKKSPNSKKGRS